MRSAATSALALVLVITTAVGVEARAASQAATLGAASLTGASTWVLRGSGWGHSLGMSQYGAMEMAKDGWSASRILRHYYTGTTYDAVTDTQILRVNIVHAAASLSASSVAIAAGGGDFTVSVPSGTTRSMTGGLGDGLSFVRSGASVKVSCGGCSGATSLSGSSVTLTWDTAAAADRTGMSIGGRVYRDGRTVIYPGAGATLEAVNHVRLHDEYLDYIREMPWSWPKEALKAQAAAARGYALRSYSSGVRSVCQCHVYDTTSDQVYGGYPAASDLPYWPAWRSAVRATGSSSTGYVVRSGGSVVRAYYSSSHGGRSESNEDVWGGTPLPYLRGVADPWSLRASNPRASWKLSPNGATVAKAFGLPDIARLDLRDRTANGGIRRAVATSTAGRAATITGEQFRTRVGVYSIAVRHLTRRFDGADRYAVGAAVAASVAPSATSVVIAAGDSTLVDAAVSGPLAGTLGAPLLLTKRGSLPPQTVKELDRRGSKVRTAYVVGGRAVVSDSVLASLRARGLTVVRVAGADRFGTSEAVAKLMAQRRTVTAVVLAGGDGLADALGASGAATAVNEPILLTPAAALAPATLRALRATGATAARVVGGPSVVSEKVVADMRNRGLSVVRLAGSDRYASSSAVADFYRARVPVTSEVVITNGSDRSLVDSLVAGTRARLLVLAPPSGLGEEAARTLQSTPLLETISAVGGTASLSASVLEAASLS
ncbi:SpoIID/LytB domain protein [Ornithinibacter aureus]|nr:SpoIID/LytB domain protein [Ornithinibacter aureus]